MQALLVALVPWLSFLSGNGAVPAPPLADALLVSGYTSERVHRFDPLDGSVLAPLGTAPGAQSARYGPDGDLYVVCETIDQVLRFDGWTGEPHGAFVADDPDTPQDETGGLDAPTAAVFGPSGDLFVASFTGDDVRRYDGGDGRFLGVFVSSGSGGLNGPDAGMVFGPDGHLYVPSFSSNEVLRYDGETGAYLDDFVGPGEGGLSRPRMLRFRGDGVLYVTSWLSNQVLRYDADGVFIDALVATTRPTGLVFEPGTGHLLVTSDQTDDVRRFDGGDGSSLGQLVASGADGLDGATYLEFHPDAELRLTRPAPGTTGALAALSITGATPHGRVVLLVGSTSSSSTIPHCPGAYIGVGNPREIVAVADGRGRAELELPLPAGAGGKTIWLQAIDRDACRVSNLVVHSIP